MAYLKVDSCQEKAWIKTDEPGFEKKGYWAIMIPRGHKTKISDNKNNSKKKLAERWVSRYENKNAERQRRASRQEARVTVARAARKK